jgi:hypothetical protein
MSLWHASRFALSNIIIDVDKDWRGYKIKNLGAPVDPNDAARKTDVDTVIPTGLIAMWSGPITSIPTGWALCDGGGGRPNLLNVFVKGVSSATTNPGSTGGSSTHQHTAPVAWSSLDGVRSAYKGPFGTGVSFSCDRLLDNGLVSAQTLAGMLTSADPSLPPYYEVAFIIKVSSPEICFRCGKPILDEEVYVLPEEEDEEEMNVTVVVDEVSKEEKVFLNPEEGVKYWSNKWEGHQKYIQNVVDEMRRCNMSLNEISTKILELNPARYKLKSERRRVKIRRTQFVHPKCMKPTDVVIWRRMI